MSRHFLSSVTLLILNSAVVVVGLIILLVSTIGWWGPSWGRWLSVPESTSPADTIVVLGGNTLSRLGTGLQLYQQKSATHLAITGYNPQQTTTNEVLVVRDTAIKQGIPANAITLLATTSTAEDAQQIAQFSRDVNAQHIIIVSDWWHGRRALCMAQKVMASDSADVTFHSSESTSSLGNWWLTEKGIGDVVLESANLAYYALKYQLPVWNCVTGDTNTLSSLLLSLAGFPASFATVMLVRRWTLRQGILDIPNGRSSHITPTPRGGGLGIVSITLIVFFLFHFVVPNLGLPVTIAFVITSALIALAGWADDRRHLSTQIRLGIQFAMAAGLLLATRAITTVYLPMLGVLSVGTLIGVVLTLLWIVGLTNVYNFMDGIDGLATSQAVVAGVSWCLLLLVENQPALFLLAGLVVTTSLGFLFQNASPAPIFMGDVGSTFLGFTLAALPVLAFSHIGNPRLLLAVA